MMRHLHGSLISAGIGMLSVAVFAVIFAATALPAIAMVEDDDAVVTWGVLAACVFIGWAAARSTHRWLILRWVDGPKQRERASTKPPTS